LEIENCNLEIKNIFDFGDIMPTFWVDRIVSDLKKRKDKKLLITDYKTPSGKVHLGALRGVIIHDAIFEGLSNDNQKVEYWYGFDDFDPMDDISVDLKKDYQKYMGQPLCNIPSPKPGFKNFAQCFAKDFEKVFRALGVKSKTIWASENYKSGKYNKGIEIVLNNAKKIREIYKNISGSEKPKDWYPLQVVCPKCGKIGTTRVFDWNGKTVSFVCEKNMVDWAEGCGYEGQIVPYDGNAKMPYKVETAVKWFTFGTSCELAGKDHYTKGGAFYVAREIAREIFKTNPAYGFGYEWILIGGKSMSSSKGVGVSAAEMQEILPDELLRFLFIRTRPKRQLEFNPEGDTIPRLYDEYDRCIDEYLAKTNSDFSKAYQYSKLSEVAPPKYRLRFTKAAYLLQMPRADIYKYAQEEKGSRLSIDEKEEIKIRIKYAKKWLKTYAPENFKFIVQEKLPIKAKKLSKDQKEFLLKIAKLIENKKYSGEELHKEIHELKKNMSISPRDAFSAIYISLLGKDSGPQAGWLLASLDKKLVIQRFKEIN